MAMEFSLDDELKMIQKTSLEFAEKELKPYEVQMEENDGLPHEIKAEIRKKALDAGLVCLTMPEEFGGGGYGTLAYTLYCEAVDSVTTGPMFACIPQSTDILRACNEEQAQRYLVPSCNAEKIEAFALTEPEAGSDSGNIKTTGVKKGDKWVLNGTKRFISHGDDCDFAIVFAITDPEKRAATAFLVDAGTPGFTVGQIHETMGYRGYSQAELVFEDCEVPEENVLGGVHMGWEQSGKWLRGGRILTSAQCLGEAARAIKLAREHAITRVQFGQPVGDFQAIQFMLAECAAELYAARWMTYKVAWDEENDMVDGRVLNEECAMVKYFGTEMLGHVVDKCLQIHGGMGYMKESPIEWIYRNARIERIWEGTSQIQLRIIGNGLRKRGQLHW